MNNNGRAQVNPIIRVFPSLTDVAFVIPLVTIFAIGMGASGLLEGDTGWHIRTGEWIMQNGRVPDRDIFSYTKPGEPWFAWEWLWDVIFAWLHQVGGMAAVIAASLLVICLTSALLFRLTRRKSNNTLVAFVVAFAATMATSIHWLARPHLFTMLFLVIFYSLLERVKDGQTNILWALPLLTALWTNLHGGFFVGIVLIGAYGAGEIVDALTTADAQRRSESLRRSAPYLWTAALCALASLVNPYTYHLHVHIVKYLRDPFLYQHIGEFQAANFQHPIATYLEPMLFVGFIAAGFNLYRRRFGYAILIFGWAHLALFSARNIPLFAIVAAPLVAELISDWMAWVERSDVASWVKRAARAITETAAEFDGFDRIARVHLSSAVPFLLVILLMVSAGTAGLFQADYDQKRYPIGAVAALSGMEPQARVFTNDEWGDYLVYRLYPAHQVFIDGRSDFYGSKFAEDYLKIVDVKYDWESRLDNYGVNTILLQADSALSGALKESARWKPVYDDGIAIIFQPRRGTASSLVRSNSSSVTVNLGKLAVEGPLTRNPVASLSQSPN